MTDYNDGKWHGWNGGECPVHPKTTVRVRLDDKDSTVDDEIMAAGQLCWDADLDGDEIICFRVVEPYVEPPKPAEKWLVGNHAFDKKEAAERFVSKLIAEHGDKYASPEWQPRLFREVQE